MKYSTSNFLIAAIVAGLIAGVGYWQWPGAKPIPPELAATVLPDPHPVTPFRLVDQDGAPFGAERFKGKWSVVFFGYTHCPDVCPTTLSSLNGFINRLKTQHVALDDIQILFVSVDPKRDSPRHIKDYLAYFDPVYLGATGERDQIDALVQQFGAIYMFEGDTSKDDYVVNHSATLYVVDPKGRLYARLSPPHEPGPMADTFIKIRNFYSR